MRESNNPLNNNGKLRSFIERWETVEHIGSAKKNKDPIKPSLLVVYRQR